jgi:hypothetical protein
MNFDRSLCKSVSEKTRFDTQVSVTLPANCYGGSSGLRFEYPIKGTKEISFRVFFPKNFTPEKGGKLFAGFNSEETCVRLMWRRNLEKEDLFGGEIYVHTSCKQHPEFQKIPGFKQTEPGVFSLFQYHFTFIKGAWNTVKMSCILNDPGNSNGIISAQVNGVSKSYNKFVYTTNKNQFTSLLFQTFYGGSDSSWSPKKDQEILFDKIKFY